MKTAAMAAFGWLLPGGAYLLARRYLQFAISLALVCGATVAGMALHGANLWPQTPELQGLDGFAAGRLGAAFLDFTLHPSLQIADAANARLLIGD